MSSADPLSPAVAPAPPADAQDLNALCPADKTVLFGVPAVVYTIPGDMPMDLYIKAQSALMSDDEVEGTNLLHQALTGTLGYYIPEGDERHTQLNRDVRKLGVSTMLKLINSLYRDDDDEEPVTDPPQAVTEPPAETPISPPEPTTTTT